MKLHTFLQLAKRMFRAPREVSQQVIATSVEEKAAWLYLVAGYVATQIAFYVLLRIPGHADFIGEEEVVYAQYDVVTVLGDAFFAVVVLFVVYKGLVHFGAKVPFSKYVLLTALMYVMSIVVALVQAPFLFLGFFGVSYVVMFVCLVYLLIAWIKAESEMFDLGVWKVFFINIGIMLVLGIGYGFVSEILLV